MAEPFIGPEAEAAARPVAQMSFEEALSELEGIVQKLERGQLDLESSIQAYEHGTALRQHCAEKLRQVQLRVEKLTQDREGNLKLVPFEEQ
jgi:exodeoxyribonuclease VII small subunit